MAESVDLKNTIFHLHNNGREWARVELYEDAIGNFERSASLRTHDHIYDWLQLAISHAHLGHREEAKQWFDKAEDSIAQMANPHAELIELRDAAASAVSDHHIEHRTVIENLQQPPVPVLRGN